MNYNHIYHAGNFADVVKHIILTTILIAIERKKTAFCYIDTHAGPGFYDLFSQLANKKKEYQNGIEKVIHQDNPPGAIKQYLKIVHNINNQLTQSKFASLRFYPGSPMIAQHLLRAHDRMILCELQPQAYQNLRTTFSGNKQVSVHHLDGYLALKSFLPPKERRGVILIDPPYENLDEFTWIARTLPFALKRFPSGTYVIWYPIKEQIQIKRFYHTLKENIKQAIFTVELTTYPDLPQHLNGCGLAIINPPWQWDQEIKALLPWLWKTLSINGLGNFYADVLK